MSEHSTPEERTEMPTDRRLTKLRSQGAMHQSNEVTQVLSLMTSFLMLGYLTDKLWVDMQVVLRRCFYLIRETDSFSFMWVERQLLSIMSSLSYDVLLLAGVTATVSGLSVMLQTGWAVKDKKIEVKLSHLNPITGIQRIFSLNGVVNVLKALVKLALILPIGYYGLKNFAPQMVALVHFDIPGILKFTGESINSLFWKIMTILILMATFDYVYSKFQWLKNNKMTKAEVKDERKAMEGDEETKRKIQHKGLARIAQRLRESVPRADVIITNPTHFSVALRYDRGTMSAPIVVAKGQDFIALKIREIAKEHGIPILERKPLARALYASCEVGSEIPQELFKAVAEVLAYVYKLKNPHQAQQQRTH
jgi:flagellar biosynthetic protein FlhB